MNIYTIIHIINGGMSNRDERLTKLFLLYQFGQLAINKRIFFLEGKIEEGNDIVHTLKKIGEFMIGKLLFV